MGWLVLTGKNKGNHSKNHLSIRGAKENKVKGQSLHHIVQCITYHPLQPLLFEPAEAGFCTWIIWLEVKFEQRYPIPGIPGIVLPPHQFFSTEWIQGGRWLLGGPLLLRMVFFWVVHLSLQFKACNLTQLLRRVHTEKTCTRVWPQKKSSTKVQPIYNNSVWP